MAKTKWVREKTPVDLFLHALQSIASDVRKLAVANLAAVRLVKEHVRIQREALQHLKKMGD